MKPLTEVQLGHTDIMLWLWASPALEIKGLQAGIFQILNSFLPFIPFSHDNAFVFQNICMDIYMNVCRLFPSKQFSAFQSSLFKKKKILIHLIFHTQFSLSTNSYDRHATLVFMLICSLKMTQKKGHLDLQRINQHVILSISSSVNQQLNHLLVHDLLISVQCPILETLGEQNLKGSSVFFF